VPSDELPPDWYGLVSLPDGVQPAVTRLYLRPAGPAGVRRLELGAVPAGLGDTVSWFRYDNVDAAALSSAVTGAVDSYPGFDPMTLHGRKLTAAQRPGGVPGGPGSASGSTAGTVLGRAAGTGTGDRVRVEFGVRTDRGYVDPVAFLRTMAGQVDADTVDIVAFALLVGSPWPVLTAVDPGALMAAAATRVYPLAGARRGQAAPRPGRQRRVLAAAGRPAEGAVLGAVAAAGRRRPGRHRVHVQHRRHGQPVPAGGGDGVLPDLGPARRPAGRPAGAAARQPSTCSPASGTWS